MGEHFITLLQSLKSHFRLFRDIYPDSVRIILGILCLVGPTPIHPELGSEIAKGTKVLCGVPLGRLVLVPGNNLFLYLFKINKLLVFIYYFLI